MQSLRPGLNPVVTILLKICVFGCLSMKAIGIGSSQVH